MSWTGRGGGASRAGPGLRIRAGKDAPQEEHQVSLLRVLLVSAFALLPEFLAYGLALVMADLRGTFSVGERRAVEDNLSALFGGRIGERRREGVVRDYFRVQLCRMVDDARLLRGGGLTPSRLEVHGFDLLQRELQKGRGAVVGGAHFGSPMACFAYIASRGAPVTMFGRQNPAPKSLTERLIRALVQVPAAKALKRRPIAVRSRRSEGEVGGTLGALRALRSKEVVGSTLDARLYADEVERAVRVRFLGGEARFLPGMVVMAQTAASPLFVALSHISKEWRHRTIEISPPISTQGPVEEVYQRCIDIIDQKVRAYPSHWNFFVVPGVVGSPG